MRRYEKLHMEVIDVEMEQMLAASDVTRTQGQRLTGGNEQSGEWGSIWDR